MKGYRVLQSLIVGQHKTDLPSTLRITIDMHNNRLCLANFGTEVKSVSTITEIKKSNNLRWLFEHFFIFACNFCCFRNCYGRNNKKKRRTHLINEI